MILRHKHILTILMVFSTILEPSKVYTKIPDKAKVLLPQIKEITNDTFPLYPHQSTIHAYVPALFEHESCITLKSRRCFSPKSRLFSTRKNGQKEEGAGLTQLTRVWHRSGNIRFDTLTRLTRKYPKQLSELTWRNVYDRPDLQMKAGLLLWRDNYNRIKRVYGFGMREIDLIAMSDAAYNGGYGGLRKDIRLCMTTKGCNPKKWFNNVEKTCSKSKRKLYGRRSACEINRHHVRDIMFRRLLKYHIYSIKNKRTSKNDSRE